MTIKESLGQDGPLAQAIPDYSYRPQQIAFAEQVAEALAHHEQLIVEAGTGTGKTLAYLVPSIISGKKTLIATGTKALQDQLFHRDLPTVRDALGVPCNIALLKGRSNYLCHYRVKRNETRARFASREQLTEFQRIQDWAHTTRDGDISELSALSEDSPVWSLATSTADNCLGSECEFINKCCVNEARARAQKADVVVINHHLFFADLALRDEGITDLLPDRDAIIFDEAHQLPEVGVQFFGTSVSARQIQELMNDALLEIESTGLENKAIVENANDGIIRTIQSLHQALGQQSRAAWKKLKTNAEAQAGVLELAHLLLNYYKLFEGLAEHGKGLESVAHRAVSLHDKLNVFLQVDESAVQWFDSRKSNFVLYKTPLEIAEPFQDNINRYKQAIIFTSATLSSGDNFDFFKNRLGLNEAKTARWDSPFDYEHNSLLYLPENMPNPTESGFIERVVDTAIPVINACQGRTFMLFTSHHGLNQAAELLKDELDYPLLIQGTVSKRRLIEQFRSLGNAVLLGTASFWEGVDIKGEALSCVIIDKLPFSSPTDPITAARIDGMRQQGREPFREYQIPQAIIALRQGVGRLIRDEKDRGVLMLCDPRILSKSYGRMFLRCLPRMPITQRLADITRFMTLDLANSSSQDSIGEGQNPGYSIKSLINSGITGSGVVQVEHPGAGMGK